METPRTLGPPVLPPNVLTQRRGPSVPVQPDPSGEEEYKKLLAEWTSLRDRYRLAIQGMQTLLPRVPPFYAYLRNRFVCLEADLGNEFRVDPPAGFTKIRWRRLRGKVGFLNSRSGVPLLEQTRIDIPRAIDRELFRESLPLGLGTRRRERLQSGFERVPESLRNPLARTVKHKQGLSGEEVSWAIGRSQTLHPAAFSSDESFREAIARLQFAPSKWNESVRRFIFPGDENRTLYVLIHGSSVEGLRSKPKEDKGWKFGPTSDIDLTIVDPDRFLWAQAAGIPTRIGVKTVELNLIDLKTLKLTKFVSNFSSYLQTLGIRQPVNVCIYRTLESARTHSGFSLLCECPPNSTPVVKRIFSEGTDQFGEKLEEVDKGRALLAETFGPNLTALPDSAHLPPTSLEKEWKKTNKKRKLIRFTYEAISEAIRECAHTFPHQHGKEEPSRSEEAMIFLQKIIESALRPIESVSRQHHPEVAHEFFANTTQLSSTLFSQAFANFKSCLVTICEGLRNGKTGIYLSQLVVPLQKSFVAVLEYTVDLELFKVVKEEKLDNDATKAFKAATMFLERGKGESKRIFKEQMLEFQKRLGS